MFSSSVLHDARFAFRGLLKAPGISFVVILTLAVAIGANTAIFSVVESVLLQPLPYPDEGRIVRVAATVYASRGGRGDRGNAFADRAYWHFADNQRSFEKFGAYWGPDQLPLTGDGPPRRVGVASMTLSAFEVLGVFPELGRLPTPEEDAPGGPSVALLSHDLWVSQYGSDPSILGKTVDLNGTPRAVIGVMPASYDFPTYPGPGLDVDLWIPFQLDPASTNIGSVYINAIARLGRSSPTASPRDGPRCVAALAYRFRFAPRRSGSPQIVGAACAELARDLLRRPRRRAADIVAPARRPRSASPARERPRLASPKSETRGEHTVIASHVSTHRVRLATIALILASFAAGQVLAQATDLPNRKDPLQGVTTAGQPTAEQLAAAAKSGFKTVIDLRGVSEDRGMDEKATVEKLGMSYVTLPVEGAGGVSYANATALDKLLSRAQGPVLIHCATGNRAGALLALRGKLAGADNEAALALGVASGLTGLKPAVEQKLAQGHD